MRRAGLSSCRRSGWRVSTENYFGQAVRRSGRRLCLLPHLTDDAEVVRPPQQATAAGSGGSRPCGKKHVRKKTRRPLPAAASAAHDGLAARLATQRFLRLANLGRSAAAAEFLAGIRNLV